MLSARLAIGYGYRLEQDGNGCTEMVMGPLRVGVNFSLRPATADSVRFNIVEGCGLNSDNQLARCLKISLGSANELQDQLDELDENGMLPPEYQDLKTETSGVRSVLVGFYRTVTTKKRKHEMRGMTTDSLNR